MRRLIAGNWKMNGLAGPSAALAEALRQACGADGAAPGCDLLVCPPATVLAAVAAILAGSPIELGGQDCQANPSGAFTGDISAEMLRDAGATWVIVGHSERRAGHRETDDFVRSKVAAATRAGLRAIVCVGETADQRAEGRETEVVGWQIAGSLPKDFSGVLAYEPVWAIGAGTSASEADVATMHHFIREELVRELGTHGAGIPILYGGSVKPSNAAALMAIPDVGGALVGGASLVAADFLAIARAAAEVAVG